MAEATILQIFRSQAETANSVRFLKHNINNACLCPSMDLIMIKDSSYSAKSNTTTNVKIFNTVDRREVATLQLPPDNNDDDNKSTNVISCFAWSPNGQSVAVVVTNFAERQLLRQVQETNNSDQDNNASGRVFLFHILTAQAGKEPLEPYHSFTVKGMVLDVTWCMVGKNLPYRWMYTHEEEEQELTWRTQLRYVDQSSNFLPQSGYMVDSDGIDSSVAMTVHDHPVIVPPDEDISTLIPEAHNALTALCLTKATECDLFLHGRSWLGTTVHTIPPNHPIPFTVSSSDMTYWVTASSLPSSFTHSISIAHLPWIKDEQPKLKQVSASMASIQASLGMLDQSVVADDWKTSLKRLDQILQMMVDELTKYGIHVASIDEKPKYNSSTQHDALDLAEIIKVYITAGASADGQSYDEYTNVANAMDTFFTKGQLHDRLLERLDESMQTALANVESTVRKLLVRPSQALVVQVGELTRLSLKDQQLVQELHRASGVLLSSVTELQKRIVHSRGTIRQFCEWLRSARALVQSKGTTVNPNLKKRRVKSDVLKGVVSALSHTDINVNRPKTTKTQGGITESLLNLRVTELIKGVDESEPENISSYAEPSLMPGTFSVQPSLEKVKKTFQSFLARPFVDAPEKISPGDEFLTTLTLPATENSRIAAHTRIGTDLDLNDMTEWMDPRDLEHSYFMPNVVAWTGGLAHPHNLLRCRQWLVVAKWQDTIIQLYCIPLARGETKYVLTAKLQLPVGRTILALGFYGDDGKSSLSSGSDGGTGKEGPYDIAFLCQNKESSLLDMWFVPCTEEIGWQAVSVDSLAACEMKDGCCFRVVPASHQGENNDNDENTRSKNTLLAQTMVLPSSILADEYMLHFSATRGTVLVTSFKSDEGTVMHTVLDMAKKDDDEEEEDDEETEDEVMATES